MRCDPAPSDVKNVPKGLAKGCVYPVVRRFRLLRPLAPTHGNLAHGVFAGIIRTAIASRVRSIRLSSHSICGIPPSRFFAFSFYIVSLAHFR